MPPHVLILRAPGTNCDLETAFAFERAGAKTERLHVNRVLENPGLFERFQILCLPGGFSYGDDVAAGRILGNQIQHHLAEADAGVQGRRQAHPRHLQRLSGPHQVRRAPAARRANWARPPR